KSVYSILPQSSSCSVPFNGSSKPTSTTQSLWQQSIQCFQFCSTIWRWQCWQSSSTFQLSQFPRPLSGPVPANFCSTSDATIPISDAAVSISTSFRFCRSATIPFAAQLPNSFDANDVLADSTSPTTKSPNVNSCSLISRFIPTLFRIEIVFSF